MPPMIPSNSLFYSTRLAPLVPSLITPRLHRFSCGSPVSSSFNLELRRRRAPTPALSTPPTAFESPVELLLLLFLLFQPLQIYASILPFSLWLAIAYTPI
ncbi:hypothetical protein CRG98_012700 [Punica granatum]|uniref:Uncharacterized protein n=1 Tax=Punica granatum TaxID=22663 RepID=A0A2I0KEK4_PUNGR|nr:hypothetical protein CRG98_012700 [Punica granatum]